MATVPVEMTAVAGAVLTAAQWNANVRDAVNFMITSAPILQVRQTVAQSVANGNTTVGALFDVEDVDNDAMHSTSTNTSRATAQTAGRYMFAGGVSFVANATARKGCWWLLNSAALNGSEAAGPSSAANTTVVAARTIMPFLNAGDFIELLPYQESGGALNTSVSSFEQSSMSAAWLRTV